MLGGGGEAIGLARVDAFLLLFAESLVGHEGFRWILGELHGSSPVPGQAQTTPVLFYAPTPLPGRLMMMELRVTETRVPLVWMDLEMTGLDPDEHVIIEIATLLTTADLEIIAEGPVLAIRQPESELAKMDAWNVEHHGASGLVERVRSSSVEIADAERLTLEFLQAHVPAGASPLCGNSVHQDRRFLVRQMPAIDAFLHYRIIDVSTVKELARRWAPAVLDGFVKQGAHLALDDIRESVAELRHYRDSFFRLPD